MTAWVVQAAGADVTSAASQIKGIIPIGTSMDYESGDSRKKGSWDAHAIATPFFENWTSATPTPDFVIDESWRTAIPALAFGDRATPERLHFWDETYQAVYRGDEGRKKARMSLLALVERDSLLWRIGDIKCPVKWLHVSASPSPLPGFIVVDLVDCCVHSRTNGGRQGTKDAVWPAALASEQVKLFTSSSAASVVAVPGGSHFLNVTHARIVHAELLEMVLKIEAT